MKGYFQRVTIGEVAAFIRNGLSVKQGKDGRGLPITRIETISNGVVDPNRVGYAGILAGEKDDWLLKRGDILISHINSKSHLGKCAIYDGEPTQLIHGMNLLNLRLNQRKAYPWFIHHMLRTPQFIHTIAKITKDSVNQSSFNITSFQELEIPLPPLEEQKRIAAILDKADAIRRKRQQAIELADDFLCTTFLDMFGDPVTNPKGWQVKPLSRLCDVRDGTHDSPKYVSSGYPLITSRNLKDGFIDFSDVNLISEEDYLQINKRSAVDYGDILMPMIGTIGNPVLVETYDKFAIKNVALIKFKDAVVTNNYILHLLKGHYFDWIIKNINRGGTQQFIALTDIRNFPIPIPSKVLMHEFDQFVKKFKILEINHDLMDTDSSKLFSSLTQRAFRGEL